MFLKETLEYYYRNKSTAYCTMLDATKTFDQVLTKRSTWKLQANIVNLSLQQGYGAYHSLMRLQILGGKSDADTSAA